MYTNKSLNFDTTTIGRFSSILRYNVEIYLNLYAVFVQKNYPLIYNYFTKPGTPPDSASFGFLADMIQESDKLNSLIKVHFNSFQKVDDWNLLDFIEEVRTKLQTVDNLSKWTRSSSTKNSWSAIAVQTGYQLKRYQTLEDVTLSVLSDNNNQNDWTGLAVENNLFEGDYNIAGGTQVEITQPLGSTPNLFLKSVVDNLTGEKLYGLDFNNKINWVNEDLALLSYVETVIQACNTLTSLKKGDIPEFFDFGVDTSLFVGGDLGSLSYVSIIRQMTQLFTSDDSLRNFNINQISYNGSVLKVNFSINTFYNLMYNGLGNLVSN